MLADAMTPGDGAVVAHVLLNRLALVAGRAATLRARWDKVPPEVRDEWLTSIAQTAEQTSAVFQLLVQGHDVSTATEDGG